MACWTRSCQSNINGMVQVQHQKAILLLFCSVVVLCFLFYLFYFWYFFFSEFKSPFVECQSVFLLYIVVVAFALMASRNRGQPAMLVLHVAVAIVVGAVAFVASAALSSLLPLLHSLALVAWSAVIVVVFIHQNGTLNN